MQSATHLFSALDRLIELDVAESLKQRERVEFLSLMDALIEALPDALIVVDLKGEIVFTNHRAELMFGYPRSEMIGQPVETLLPERYRARHGHQRELYSQFEINRRAQTMGVGLDLMGVRKDGREFPAEISLSRMATPTGVLALALVRGSQRVLDRPAGAASASESEPPREDFDAGQ